MAERQGQMRPRDGSQSLTNLAGSTVTAGLAVLMEKGWPWAPHCLESSVIGGVKGNEGL